LRPPGPRAAPWLALLLWLALPAAARAQLDLDAPTPRGGEAPAEEPGPAERREPAPPERPGHAAGREGEDDRAAETAEGLGEPRPEGRRPEREEPSEPPGEEEPWDGPRVELGYAHYALADGYGGGDVHAALFGGFVPTGVVRLEGWAEAGSRSYSLAQNDALIRATVLVGYQHLPLRPFVPYAGVVGTVGILIGKRFRTPVSHFFGGAGLEIGADVNLVRTLYVGLGLAYLRVSKQAVGHDLWMLRLRVGL